MPTKIKPVPKLKRKQGISANMKTPIKAVVMGSNKAKVAVSNDLRLES